MGGMEEAAQVACPRCGGGFRPVWLGQVYCTARCQMRAGWARRKKRQHAGVPAQIAVRESFCRYCCRELPPMRLRYCSEGCRTGFRRRGLPLGAYLKHPCLVQNLRHVVCSRVEASTLLFNRVPPIMDATAPTAPTATAATATASTATMRHLRQAVRQRQGRLSKHLFVALRAGPAECEGRGAAQEPGLERARPHDAREATARGERDLRRRARAGLARRLAGGTQMMELFCGCRTPTKWRCTGYSFCRDCGTMISLSKSRCVCASCPENTGSLGLGNSAKNHCNVVAR